MFWYDNWVKSYALRKSCKFVKPPVGLYLISEKLICKNQVQLTGFLLPVLPAKIQFVKFGFSNLIFQNSNTDQQGVGLECPVTFWRIAKLVSVNQFGYLFWSFLRLTSLEPKAERSSIEMFFNLAPDNISVIFIKWSLNSVSKGVGFICNGACGQLFSWLFLK